MQVYQKHSGIIQLLPYQQVSWVQYLNISLYLSHKNVKKPSFGAIYGRCETYF